MSISVSRARDSVIYEHLGLLGSPQTVKYEVVVPSDAPETVKYKLFGPPGAPETVEEVFFFSRAAPRRQQNTWFSQPFFELLRIFRSPGALIPCFTSVWGSWAAR